MVVHKHGHTNYMPWIRVGKIKCEHKKATSILLLLLLVLLIINRSSAAGGSSGGNSSVPATLR